MRDISDFVEKKRSLVGEFEPAESFAKWPQ